MTDTPKRIQRRRTRGWRMPEGAVYVGRPTKWGNPFWHAARFYGIERSLRLYANSARGMWLPQDVKDFTDGAAKAAHDDHHEWMRAIGRHPSEVIASELRGKDLACWCALDQPCHADVLLELANKV